MRKPFPSQHPTSIYRPTPLNTVTPPTPFRRGMHEGTKQSSVVHRIAFFDAAGHVASIVSQSDLIRFLARPSSLEQMGPLRDLTIEHLGMLSHKVLTLNLPPHLLFYLHLPSHPHPLSPTPPTYQGRVSAA